MALTPSTMQPLGSPAPDFALADVTSGKTLRLADVAGGRVLVVMFLCNHCPYVKHLKAAIAQLPRDYAGKGAAFVAISANDPEGYPDDAPAKLAEDAKACGYEFPFLFDATQETAKAYGAACTPDFFVYDAGRRLVYRGQYDDSRPANGIPVTGKDLRGAIDAALAGAAPPEPQRPSVGCNIKWRAGNEPAYARTAPPA
jgi:peroxiredoxin